MSTQVEERRRFQRVTLMRPLAGRLGDTRIFLINLSVSGARVAHREKFASKSNLTMTFSWDGNDITFVCKVTRTDIDKASREPGQTVYHSGVEFLEALDFSDNHLRNLIADHISRAMDEQKANARGLPPLSTTTVQTGAKSSGYIRCQYINKNWRKTSTQKADQPLDGFTVSAQEDPQNIDLLCSTYESSDIQGRKMIRQMAELSVSKAEGIPTRRFQP